MNLGRRGLLIGVVIALCLAVPGSSWASGASAARTTAATKARRAFAVLRHHKTKRDVMRLRGASRTRRARLAAFNSRLVYDGGADVRVYLVLDGTRLCLSWVSDVDGYSGGGCEDAAAVASGKALLYGSVSKPTLARVAVATVDGSSNARLVPDIGAPIGLAIRSNAIFREVTSPSVIEWTGPDGRNNATVAIGPRPF